MVDDIINGQRMEYLMEELADVPFAFVMLMPSLEAVREREAGRGTALHHAWG